jgi:DNA-binding NarL/FixJ family response regulator
VIRVLVVDDHAMVRAGLSQLVAGSADMELVGQAADGWEAVDLAGRTIPDVVLMDLAMPGLDGVAATRRIAKEHPGIHIVVLTSFSDRERILEALDAGADGYLLKDADADELLRGIRAAARGEAPLDPKVARALLTSRAERRDGPALTDREQEVLSLVADGLANKLIAQRLGIAEKTVKAHLTTIFQRIEVTNRTQAAAWAREHGLARGSAGLDASTS